MFLPIIKISSSGKFKAFKALIVISSPMPRVSPVVIAIFLFMVFKIFNYINQSG